jgi:hypothetical protein
MLNIIKNTINRVFASGVDSDASAFITATGLSGTTQKSAITTLVKDLKSSGLWSKMKAVYPMVTDNRNLLSYTEDFSNALWSKTNTTITANATTNPFGANTATKLIENSGSGSKYVALTTTSTTVSQTYTFSVYLKAAERSWAIVGQDTLGTGYFWVNLSNGTFGSGAGTYLSRSITSAGNGWYKITVTYSAASTSANGIVFISSADGAVNYTGNGTNGIFISSPQLELGTSTISAYQPILTTPAAFMASQMKYNLKDARDLDAAFRLTWSGGWTYSATGATPNGTNAYADTKLATNILGLDSAHLSLYSRTNSNGTIIDIGSSNSASAGYDFQLVSRFSNINYSILNSKSPTGFAQTTSLGFALVSRVLSTGYAYFLNNSKTSVTKASDTRNSFNIYIAARNTANVAEYFSNRETAFASIGDGLNDQDAQLLNQIVEKYQVALSRGVQAAQSFYYNSAYSNEANTYLYSTQITGTTQVSAINTLINGLKANNLWSKMKAVYPFVTDYRNILGYTEDFTNAYWNKYGSTITANTVIAPNGTLTADTLQEDTANTEHHVKTTLNGLSPNETYTYSKYVKYNNRRYMLITVYYNGGIYPVYYARFDILNGVFVSQSGGSGATIINSSITADNNGWYRISVSGQLGAFSNNIIVQTNLLDDSLAQIYLGTSKSAYIWGAQFEIGASATAYQPVLAANSSSTFMSSQMKFNLVNPQDSDAAFRLAFSGGWTYSTNGAQPNGTNGFANTYALIPSQNSGSLGFYSRTNSVAASCSFGGTTVQSGLFLTYLPNQSFLRINDAGSSGAISTTDSFGLFIANRVSGTETRNLVKGAIVAQSANSIGTQTVPNYIGALNQNGSGSLYDNKQCAFAFVADGFSDAELLLLNTLINSYQTTLSRNV